jgi:hypothetical protein
LPFRFGHAVTVAALASALANCRTPADAAHPTPVAIAVQQSLDSCNSLAWRRPEGDIVHGKNGSRKPASLTGAMRDFRLFSLFVPDSAHVVVTNAGLGGIAFALPGCSGCRFDVGIHVDSGINLEARIARIVAAQRTIDSINAEPHADAREFDNIDGPPQRFTTATGRGYMIDNDCGDCASTTLLFGRPGNVAVIGLGGDDDVPDLARHSCEMTAIGKSFAWRQ